MSAVVTVTLPLRLISVANAREHWAKRARRATAHRNVARMATTGRLAGLRLVRGAIAVTLTRIGVRRLDSDNLASACKAVRDGVADALGIDDGDPRVAWRYEQRRGQPHEYAVEIRIERRDPARITTGVAGDGVNIHSPERNGEAFATTGPTTAPGREGKGTT